MSGRGHLWAWEPELFTQPCTKPGCRALRLVRLDTALFSVDGFTWAERPPRCGQA